MQRLSDVPWNQLQYGDQVISALDNLGVIYQLDPNPDMDKALIHIIWSNHKKSIQPHYLLNKVLWKGPREQKQEL